MPKIIEGWTNPDVFTGLRRDKREAFVFASDEPGTMNRHSRPQGRTDFLNHNHKRPLAVDVFARCPR